MSNVKKPGPPPLVIPQEFIDALEETYEEGIPNSVPVDNVSDGEEFIRVGNLYAKRVGKSFRTNWNNQKNVLSYQLTDKRPYTKSSLQREK